MRHGKPDRPPLIADERGQSLAFVMTTLLALMLICAVSINIGQAITRRLLLQVAADAGAFTGATVMARGLNTVAQQNRRIQEAWSRLADATFGFTSAPCPASDLGVASYGAVYGSVSQLIRSVNTGYGALALAEARDVTRENAIELFPGEQLAMAESEPSAGLFPQRPPDQLVNLEEVPNGTEPAVSSRSPGFTVRSWSCFEGPSVQPRSAAFGLWYQMQASTPIQFVWVVKSPRVRARFFDQFFGGFSVPEMTAAAVAKPVGGDIKRGRTDYVAKMTMLRDLTGRVFDAAFRRFRTIHH